MAVSVIVSKLKINFPPNAWVFQLHKRFHIQGVNDTALIAVEWKATYKSCGTVIVLLEFT